MKLENIGFYTLSDYRAKNSSMFSPLYRCELLVTDRCNFHCPYCRGLQNGKDLSFKKSKRILEYWISEGLKNVRFSGGEPTLYEELPTLVRIAKRGGVQHIAISTNGSNTPDLYKRLAENGVNDFSISLDACCANTGDTMAGEKGAWKKVVKNIELLSSFSYVSVGVVLNEINENEATRTVMFAHKLGVADIRIIPSAQYNRKLHLNVPSKILDAHPILKYRLTNKRHVRGMHWTDSRKCKLVLDDMVVWNGNHYPCIIYLREGGIYQKPIGYINDRTRQDRFNWYTMHDSWKNNICRENCLDVCIAYNNMAKRNV
jgi:molybdenum cofactor biosynthesis enzyme MoaA